MSEIIKLSDLFYPQRFMDIRFRYVHPLDVSIKIFPIFAKYNFNDRLVGNWLSLELTSSSVPLTILYETTVGNWITARRELQNKAEFKFMFQDSDDLAYFRLMMS